MMMLLQDKVAAIYGPGAIGTAVAQAFAREGAQVFLGGHHESTLKQAAQSLQEAGCSVQTALVDALDTGSVEGFVESVVKTAGRLDVSFCLTNANGGQQGSSLAELSYDDFSLPIIHYTKSQFLTANAASRQMVKQGSGVIMMMTAIPSRIPMPFTAGFGPAWAAVEALLRTLAVELGPHGIRTVCLHSGGTPGAAKSIDEEKLPVDPVLAERFEGWGQRTRWRNLIGKWPTLEDVGNMAAFLASDRAGVTTGATINLNGGMIND
jgi:3-oxoacyl-[acyl-carrier protein] reductase